MRLSTRQIRLFWVVEVASMKRFTQLLGCVFVRNVSHCTAAPLAAQKLHLGVAYLLTTCCTRWVRDAEKLRNCYRTLRQHVVTSHDQQGQHQTLGNSIWTTSSFPLLCRAAIPSSADYSCVSPAAANYPTTFRYHRSIRTLAICAIAVGFYYMGSLWKKLLTLLLATYGIGSMIIFRLSIELCLLCLMRK